MLKTLLHIVVATAIWFAAAALGLGIPWRLGAIFLGAIAVHLVWEHLIFNPNVYLGAMPVSDDDPIMQKAREKALQTLPEFLTNLFPKHPQDSMVKFRFQTSFGEVENLWADLLEISGDRLKVYVRTLPMRHDRPLDRHQRIALADVVDWQVEYQDGTTRGGYTNRALFTIYEREEGQLHPNLRPLLAQYRGIDGETEA